MIRLVRILMVLVVIGVASYMLIAPLYWMWVSR